MGWQAANSSPARISIEAKPNDPALYLRNPIADFRATGEEDTTGDTKNGITARFFLYWTHGNAGRRLAANVFEDKNQKRARQERETRIT
jgi:hypothetical protein